MKKSCLILTLLCLAAPAHAAMEAGKWQITMRSETAGEKPTDMTMTQCMTAEQVRAQSGASAMEQQTSLESSDGDCKNKMETKGNVMVVESNCASGETTKTTLTQGDNSFSMKTINASGGQTTSMTMEGKRLGGC